MNSRFTLLALLLLSSLPIAHSKSGLLWRQDGAAPDLPDRRHGGSVVGTVSDSKGSAVSGATVLLKDSVTQEPPSTVTTNDQGQYKLASLLPGDYELWATKGEQESEHRSIKVANGAASVENLTLKKGSSR
jgi:protocatechuate 3,4-dioxygenase beta subunit